MAVVRLHRALIAQVLPGFITHSPIRNCIERAARCCAMRHFASKASHKRPAPRPLNMNAAAMTSRHATHGRQ
jgi:hypothetical protein